jgi:HAE1 family hydrophobic/amphiphilic exporter-1/multidrug efflux pump
MFITELSIKRPTVSWVMSLILIVFGLFVFWKLPVRELPNGIQPPVVQIQVDYKSAAASIVDQEVTQVVEDVIGGAEGIKNIDSKSENGRSTINVEFDTSIDLELLIIYLQSLILHKYSKGQLVLPQLCGCPYHHQHGVTLS